MESQLLKDNPSFVALMIQHLIMRRHTHTVGSLHCSSPCAESIMMMVLPSMNQLLNEFELLLIRIKLQFERSTAERLHTRLKDNPSLMMDYDDDLRAVFAVDGPAIYESTVE
uniref:Uncharacterized protein n=1 Tax=Strigamia maritima TaxID=126957 RepID=T1JIQ1_STRMM